MNQLANYTLPFAFLLLGLSSGFSQDNRQRKPNIVVIVADDLGYDETGMMGNREIPTPGIDALAKDGVRCTSGYVTAAYCSSSRAGFMTGRYQSRFGYDINPTGKRNLLPQAGLPTTETTFAKRLAMDANYKTALVGKWHLGTVPKTPGQSRLWVVLRIFA